MSKIEQFWQDATADDVARVMAGETVEARFRDSESVKWVENGCSLAGWCAGVWTSSSGLPWVFCQVYDPPQWWLDKPDPGPGWRLLGKFPDEPKLATDEGWNWDEAKWQPIARGGEQEYATWYRRRIEPVEVVGPVEQLIAGGSYWHPNGLCFFVTEKGFEVTR
jgi:hypothetical protein